MTDMSNQEWAASLTAEQVEWMVNRSLETGDVRGFEAALLLLSAKDAHRAALILAMVEAGIAGRVEKVNP